MKYLANETCGENHHVSGSIGGNNGENINEKPISAKKMANVNISKLMKYRKKIMAYRKYEIIEA
jgi:hypothetical protein